MREQTAWCGLHERIERIVDVLTTEKGPVPGARVARVVVACGYGIGVVMSERNLAAARTQAAA